MKRVIPILLMALACPAMAENDFLEDPNVVGLWTMEDLDATDTADTSGNGQTLTNNSSKILAETSIFMEGAVSADWNGEAIPQLERSNANMVATFPGKNGSGNNVWSFTAWIRIETITDYQMIGGMWQANERSWSAWVYKNGTDYFIQHSIGYNSGGSGESVQHTGVSLAAGQWYHVGLTYDGSDKSYRIRVWDEDGSSVTETTGTGTEAMNIEDTTFTLMNGYGYNYPIQGYMDEAVVFNDVLTADEIDQIRMGTYGAGEEGAGPQFIVISQ